MRATCIAWNSGHDLRINTECSFSELAIMFVQVVHQLIERKQAEIRKVHPGLSGFSDTVKRIDIKDIPGIRKQSFSLLHYSYCSNKAFVYELIYVCIQFSSCSRLAAFGFYSNNFNSITVSSENKPPPPPIQY